MTQEAIWRPDAPFRQYKETDESMYQSGYQRGLEWPAKWDHVPGGPYYPEERPGRKSFDEGGHPDWIAYCRLLKKHHHLWMQGWYAGFAENAKLNPEIKQLRNRLLMNKLASDG